MRLPPLSALLTERLCSPQPLDRYGRICNAGTFVRVAEAEPGDAGNDGDGDGAIGMVDVLICGREVVMAGNWEK